MFKKKFVIPVIAVLVAAIALSVFLFFKNGDGDSMGAKGLDIKISTKYLNSLGDCKQLVVVTSKEYVNSDAVIRTYEKEGDTWKAVMPATQACIGAAGFAAPGEKKEGDYRSPTGAFTFGTCFGNYPNPGTKMEYKETNDDDYWVDDSESEYYNTWQTGEVDGRWASAEALGLTGGCYDYAAVINYNTEERTPGLGSAIFFHVWNGPGGITAGCTAMSEETILSIFKWFDPAKKPMILQGVESELAGETTEATTK